MLMQVRALLGEMRLEQGSVDVRGRVAYVAQSAWIPNDSLKNAVLFGESLDVRRYGETLQACGLLPDLELLEVGGGGGGGGDGGGGGGGGGEI
jgi:hypothetical protein